MLIDNYPSIVLSWGDTWGTRRTYASNQPLVLKMCGRWFLHRSAFFSSCGFWAAESA